MNNVARMMSVVGAAFLVCVSAHADVSLDSIRLGARDIESVVRFYERAFGFREVSRLENGDHKEVFLDLGATGPSSTAAPAPRLIIMMRKEDSPKDSMSHLILRVTDIDKTSQTAKAVGGSLIEEPHAIPGGMMAAEVLDPAGNHVQIVQLPSH